MRTSLIVLLSVFLCGCASLKSVREKKTPEEQRLEIRAERNDILKQIYEKHPELEAKAVNGNRVYRLVHQVG